MFLFLSFPQAVVVNLKNKNLVSLQIKNCEIIFVYVKIAGGNFLDD